MSIDRTKQYNYAFTYSGCPSGRQYTSNRQLCSSNIDFATGKAHTDDYWYTGDHWNIHLNAFLFNSISTKNIINKWVSLIVIIQNIFTFTKKLGT